MANVAINQILDTIEARFANLTVANGYNYDAKKITRARLKPFDGIDLPAVNFFITTMRSVDELHRKQRRNVNLVVEYYAKTYDDPFVDISNKLAFDVVTGLNRDILAPGVTDSQSRNLGGDVVLFTFDNYALQIGHGQKPFCGIVATFNIEYLAPNNDMEVYYGN